MNATAKLNQAGQSLWLDNITRVILDDGTLQHFIDDLSVTGLTSNPSIYDKAVGGSDAYDADVRAGAERGDSSDDIFFSLALDDLRRAADLFRPVYDRTGGVDGFVSLEVSPLIAYKAAETIAEAARLHALGGKPNLFIKIPGTSEGLAAIEETIYAGVPVNVTLLFSVDQYRGCLDAFTRGVERRVADGLTAYVPSVASFFVSRWDGAIADRVPAELKNGLGLAVGRAAYVDYRAYFASDRWQRLLNVGARPQRLLFASTGTKDPAASDVLYIDGLAAPYTVNTMPQDTLLAYADHGADPALLVADAVAAEAGLAAYTAAGLDLDALAAELQTKGAASFVKSWESLMDRISAKVRAVPPAR